MPFDAETSFDRIEANIAARRKAREAYREAATTWSASDMIAIASAYRRDRFEIGTRSA